ncbi:phosphoglucomutase [Paenibacillus sp. FSL H8-0122]|uniref:phosphoglucomutase n=1 Tax=Paenibacillus sp. FSL H8-0122 TaxID=2954510 RepID=UPI0030F77919
MAYPDDVDVFTEKLNKSQTGRDYVVEERIAIAGGYFDGLLRHDNINNKTIRVYTGPRFTGEEIRNYSVSFPDATPWRRIIRIFTAAPEVYVTYETPGDTVEADDINAVQVSITATQTEVERYKASGQIDGGSFTREV